MNRGSLRAKKEEKMKFLGDKSNYKYIVCMGAVLLMQFQLCVY